MLEFPKIVSAGSSGMLFPETTENRFKPLTFAKHFERQKLWNGVEQRTPSYLNTALKVLLTVPLLLIQKTTQTIQGLGNASIFLGNCLLSKRAVAVVSEDNPILDNPKNDTSKTEIAKPLEPDFLERVKIVFADIADPSSQLRYAASKGYLEGVKIALENPKTNINYQSFYQDRDDFGSTALIEAAHNGHKEIVELLLQAGANPNIVDASGMSDCELSIVDKSFKNGHTALMRAAIGRNNINNPGNKEIVELLLNAKADPNIQDLRGKTALILAAEYGRTEIAELLLNKGANPNIKTFTKNMVTFRSQNDWTALMEAAQNGRKEIVRLLLDAKAAPNIQSEDGDTALILAANRDQPDTVKLLLKAKADPNIQNKQGVTALIRAAYYGYTDIVKELLNVNADLNIKNSKGVTALIWAADRGYKVIAELLINAKADLNIQSQSGETALMLATEKRHKEIVKLLLEAGADSNIKDTDGRTVLSRLRFAYKADDIVQLIESFDQTLKSS